MRSEDQAEKKKAQKTIVLLYVLMVVFIAGPIIIYLLVR